MDVLTPSERELVALGAAMGSNCVPCIDYHIPKARDAGLCDGKITEAIRLADRVRQVPARKVLAAALGMLPPTAGDASPDAQAGDPGPPTVGPGLAVAGAEAADAAPAAQSPCCA